MIGLRIIPNNLIINLYKNMSNKSSRVDKFLCCRSFQIELVEFFDRNPRWDIYGQRTHYLNLSGDLTPYLLHLLVQLLEFSPQLDSRFQLFIDTLFVSDTWSSSLNVPAFLILSRFYILEKPERLVKLISDFCWNNDPQKVSVGYLLLKVAIVSFGINNWSIWGDAWAKLLYPDGVSLWDSISFDSNTLPRRNLSWWIKGHICFSLYILKFGVEGIEWVANAMGFTYDNFVKHSWIPLLKLVGLVEYVDANEAKTILVAAIRFLCGSPYLLSPSNWLTMLEIIVLHLQHQEEDIN